MTEAEGDSPLRILNIFEFEGAEYAAGLWRPAGEDEKLVVMRLVDYGDAGSIPQNIDDDVEFERVVAHVKNSLADAERDGKVPWWSLVASELFAGFGVDELPHYPLDRRRRAILIAPEEFREVVGLQFVIDDRQNVVGFRLELDRGWLDGSALGMRTGGNFAGSVISSTAVVDPILQEVSDQVTTAALAAPGSAIGSPHNLLNPNRNPDIESFIRTFRDPGAGAAAVTGIGVITAENIVEQGRSWLVIEWHCDAEEPTSAGP